MNTGFDGNDWGQIASILHRLSGSETVEEIASQNEPLVRDMSRFDPSMTIPLLSALLTVPELQSHCDRIEALIALAIAYCRGRRTANLNHISRWFEEIGRSQYVRREDPAEDVFVSLLVGRDGDYRILGGLWEAAGFHTQRIYDVIATIPDALPLGQLKRELRALLVISDIVCEKSGLHRYESGSDEFRNRLSQRALPGRRALSSRVTISLVQLEERGVAFEDLEPFLWRPQMRNGLLNEEVGSSSLDRHPLISSGSMHIVVALPTALSVAARDRVIKAIIAEGFADSFDSELGKVYSRLFYETPLLGGPLHTRLYWHQVGTWQTAQIALEADRGYVMSFHFLLPSIVHHTNGGFLGFPELDSDCREALQESIDTTIEGLAKERTFRQGIIILVSCGWGMGFTVPSLDLDNHQWRLTTIPGPDLVHLSWLRDMNPRYFWSVFDGLEVVKNAGVRLSQVNGILNLLGWVRHNEGHAVPHEQLPDGRVTPDRPLNVMIPTNFLLDVRVESDHGRDFHSSIDNTGRRHRVQRLALDARSREKGYKHLYASIDDLLHGHRTIVYENHARLWCTTLAPNISLDTMKQIIDMVAEWLHRIGVVLDERLMEICNVPSLRVYLEFHDSDPDGTDEMIHTDLASLCKLTSSSEPNACCVTFEIGFLTGFRHVHNVGERLVVRTLAEAYLQLLGSSDPRKEAQEIESRIVPNDEARTFHVFYMQDFRDYVLHTLPTKVIGIEPTELATARINLGWRAVEPGQEPRVTGQTECLSLLGQVVRVLANEVVEDLERFHRSSLLKHLLENIEAAEAEQTRWFRTSRAVIALNGDSAESRTERTEALSKLAGTLVASRALVEIALCVCPSEEGLQITDIDLSRLLAKSALLIRFGGLSDAIRWNALPAELQISALGDILFRDEFGRMVVEPMLSRATDQRFVASAGRYERLYEEPQVNSGVHAYFDAEFLEAWRAEMGFTIEEALRIIRVLEEKGIEEQSAVISIRRRQLLELSRSDGVGDEVVLQFLSKFSLAPRENWTKPPEGFKNKDIQPWRFGRRLSYAVRPILLVDETTDPLFLLAPGALRQALAYVVDGAHSGLFEQDFFTSTEMRNKWWGKVKGEDVFSREVAEALEQAGWCVRRNIGLPEMLQCKLDRNYGDVDVLAWNSELDEVLVIECKDLSLARNYSEIAALLAEYQGDVVDGKPDKLRRHLDRVILLESNIESVRKFTGVANASIVSWLVCSRIVPMQYATIEALANTRVGGIDDVLGS